MSLQIYDNKFYLPVEIDKAGRISKELATKDKYVDKNILIQIDTPSGQIEFNKEESSIINASTTISPDVSTTGSSIALLDEIPESGKYITIGATASNIQKGSVTTNTRTTAATGYIDAESKDFSITEEISIDINKAANKYIKIYNGELI